MFKQPFLESLAIGGIALGLLLATVWFSSLNAVLGGIIVVGCTVLLYRHYATYGTDADVLDDTTARQF